MEEYYVLVEGDETYGWYYTTPETVAIPPQYILTVPRDIDKLTEVQRLRALYHETNKGA